MANIELPLNRVVDVEITRQTIFPTLAGFGTLLICIVDNSGPLDATLRTKLYSDISSVAADYATSTQPYLAAQTAFAQNPAPLFIKLGWRDVAELVTDELSLIEAADNDWYGLTFTNELRDVPAISQIAAWIEARTKVYCSATNDANTELVANDTNIAEVLHTSGVDRTATFYSVEASEYPDVAYLARALRVDFTARDGAETTKFKRLALVSPLEKSSSVVTAVTGFVPGQGLIDNQGHFANTYVTIGGRPMTVEGNMASGEFFDIIHGVDWLQNYIQVEILSLFVSVNKVPYTDVGVDQIVQRVRRSLDVAVRAGLLATQRDPDTGTLMPEYDINVERVSNVAQSQRAQRIAPTITFIARLAGAIHYATVRGTVTV